MEQLTQNLKDGFMQILEVPFPSMNKGQILVRNHYSVISAGTESKTVKDARLGYIGKAKTRKKELKMVIDSIKTNGLLSTYRSVMNKLNAPSPLGYSCAGEVIAVSEGVTDIHVGDYVACGGAGAYHAEIISVPRNLCVKVPKEVDIKYAAFTTIASIAIQGIRQADLRFGENCVIIGLGLIGQLTVQILNAAGIKSIGIDISDNQVQLALENGANIALNRNRPDIEKIILDYTKGYGTDAVIITAGTSSNDPIELAGKLCRRKGKVVIVGAVPTGFTRDQYYKKELDLRMSCSYGPGRYDADYEEKGVDYPIGYVRWTENRNMESYIDLLAEKKINIDKLITHTFKLESAPDAYQMILDKSEPFIGILIDYDTEKPLKDLIEIRNYNYQKSDLNVGFIGAGSFAQNALLPNLKNKVNFLGVATSKGNTARNIADKYGFNYCTGNADEIINDNNISTVFIATRHNLHAEYVLKALKNKKNVFVEKPLCMNLVELENIKNEYLKNKNHLLVGFNRRFAPQVKKIKNLFIDSTPKTINYRINAGIVPKDHWTHDPLVGGGRIIGEACHFIDLAMFIAGSKIESISAECLQDSNNLNDTVVINISFENGSIANISYFSNGNKSLPKEYLEVFCAGQVAILDDFKTLTIYSKNVSKIKSSTQDKGHKNELIEFSNALKNGTNSPISFEEVYISTLATFAVLDSIKRKQRIILDNYMYNENNDNSEKISD